MNRIKGDENMNESEYLKKAIKDKYIEIDKIKNRISYKTREGIKSYPLNKPEEKVRAGFYSELIYKYKYESKRIGLEVEVPRRKPSDWADIVVYEDDNGKKPYIVVECKKDGISEAEIKQAIEQVFGNANSLRGKYAIMVAGSVRIAFDVANYPPNEREKNIISDIPIRYGKVPKYSYKKGAPEVVFGVGDRDLKKPSRQELLNKFQQCHDIIWEGGKRNPAEAFDEMSKLMFCKIWDERWITKKNQYYEFQVGTHETKKEVASRVRNIYKKAQTLEPGVFVDSIKVSDSIIYSIVQILQEISLSKADLDAKGEAFEHFLGKIFKGEMGQYFTPRELVRFMVSFLEPNEFDYIIDPACGSGGFLLEVLEQMRTKLFRELEERDADRRWRDFALDQVWGIEINSQLSRVAMMNMILHEDGHTNIENGDALDDSQTWIKEGIRKNFGKKFSLLLTNPPFGAVIKWEDKQYLEKYKMGKGRKRQKAEILFIERGLDFLRPGGRFGIVLPDGILTNSSLQYVRNFITERAQFLGVVSLPQGAFTYYGSGVQASLLFLRKKEKDEKLPENYPIFMAEAKHIGYDTTGRPDKNDFSEILKAWKDFKEYYLNDEFTPRRAFENEKKLFSECPLAFAVPLSSLKGRFDVNYYKPIYQNIIDKLKKGPFNVSRLGDIISLSNERWEKPSAGTFRYIEINDIDTSSGEIIQAKELDVKDAPSRAQMMLRKGDIIVSTTRPYRGAIALVTEEFDGCVGSTGFAVIRTLKVDINLEYLLYVLRSKIGLKQMEQRMTGGNYPAITPDELLKILIPLPPRDVQDKVVNEIRDKLSKAKKLRMEALKTLDEAKQRLEKIILGVDEK